MAFINNPQLNFTEFVESGIKKVLVEVNYEAFFDPYEEFYQYQELIQILGVDGFPNSTDQFLFNFMPVQNIEVPQGGGVVLRKRTGKLTRKDLQEDSATGDADEIRCSIQLASVAASEFTPTKILAG